MIALESALDIWLNERTAAGRETVVSAFYYLCGRGARKFVRPGLEHADLEQVAAIGLLKACDSYDSSLQTPFEAYAWMLVIGELMHYVRDHERIVRPPRRLRDLDRRARTALDQLVVRLGRQPTDNELAKELGVREQAVCELHQFRQAMAHSLDAMDLSGWSIAEDVFEREIDRIAIEAGLAQLSKVERTIIVAVYANGYSKLELAKRLGYSRRHVSRLHRGALQKMSPMWSQ
ncbi:MAG: sigma-70 family RNA polymerase sigma factor [Candidatus Eremiobacteraeota bacterium]|nr:sigma-70 family RNA polymerase sigma factor [Candidatus Eremiobacteraeota bacterium]